MAFLVLSIFSSALISIVMRLSQGRVQAPTGMLAANYLTCTIAGLCFTGLGDFLAPGEGFGFTLGLGTVNGVVYVVSLMLAQYNVAKNGVVLQSVFSKIGDLMVPLVIAIAFFGERPGALQIAGALIALIAILAMNLDSRKASAGSMAALLALFGADGLAGAMSKIYGEVGREVYSSHFLLFTFGTALVLCVAVTVLRKEKPGLKELAFGVMIGIPNYFSSRFLLQALSTVPAVVAYPLRSVGSIAVVTAAGLLLFRERLRKNQWAAVAAILLAVIFLSV